MNIADDYIILFILFILFAIIGMIATVGAFCYCCMRTAQGPETKQAPVIIQGGPQVAPTQSAPPTQQMVTIPQPVQQ